MFTNSLCLPKSKHPSGTPSGFSLYRLLLFPLPVQAFICCPSYPLLTLFSLLRCLCPFLPTLPLLSSSCPAPVPQVLLLSDPSIPLLQVWSWRKWQAEWTAGVCLAWQLSPVPKISIAAVLVQPDMKYSPSLSLKYALYKFQALGERKVDDIWCHLFFMNIHNLYIIFISKLSSCFPSQSSSS